MSTSATIIQPGDVTFLCSTLGTRRLWAEGRFALVVYYVGCSGFAYESVAVRSQRSVSHTKLRLEWLAPSPFGD